MNRLLERAFAEVSRLPDDAPERIAALILHWIGIYDKGGSEALRQAMAEHRLGVVQ